MNKFLAFLSGSIRSVADWWSGGSRPTYSRPDAPSYTRPNQTDYSQPEPQPQPSRPIGGGAFSKPWPTQAGGSSAEPTQNVPEPTARPEPTRPSTPAPSGPIKGGAPSQPTGSTDPMDPGAWWFEHSHGVSQRPSGPPWHFDFPSGDGVHAVVTNAFRPDKGKILLVRFRVDDGSNLHAFNNGQPAGDPFVSLFLQRQGDTLSAQGAYASYRFYTDAVRRLTTGEQTWEVPVSADVWHNVWGQDDSGGFDACLSNLRAFGLVFGNPAVGATAHGVGGGGRFWLLALEQH